MDIHPKGKLIVIEGGDGSGKGTQAEMLIKYCQNNNIPHHAMDFPRYETFHGQIVAAFLRGEYGALDEVSPYLASLPFALDRLSAREEIRDALSAGKLVIANRYVTSNIAHQAPKFLKDSERNEYIRWIQELEYTAHELPKEDLVVYLKVPTEIASRLTSAKSARPYLRGKTHDIHEADENYRQRTAGIYDVLAARFDNWMTVDCTKHGTILSREEIQRKVIDVLKSGRIIPL